MKNVIMNNSFVKLYLLEKCLKLIQDLVAILVVENLRNSSVITSLYGCGAY